ncbi:hypothetical protein BX592_10752 [Paraburkholderia rhizosphaerae]|uniref:Uncharacterized protein n=1 Tax=Paraburkholderia rhizosphaerae TaxID=480658 RepID=A0A4R8LUV8_9BURK|nr:hypothetical protein BX592_10752 [Paraburkholderia rhizosphaerae]
MKAAAFQCRAFFNDPYQCYEALREQGRWSR